MARGGAARRATNAKVAHATVLRLRIRRGRHRADRSASPPTRRPGLRRPAGPPPFFGPGDSRLLERERRAHGARQLDGTRSGHRVVPAAVPGRRGRGIVAVLARRRRGGFRQRRRQPAAVHAGDRDQRRHHDLVAPAPGRRVGLSGVGRVGAAATASGSPRPALHDEQGPIGQAAQRLLVESITVARPGTVARVDQESIRSRRRRRRGCGRRRRRGTRTRRCGTRASRAGPRAVAADRRGSCRRGPRSSAGRPR